MSWSTGGTASGTERWSTCGTAIRSAAGRHSGLRARRHVARERRAERRGREFLICIAGALGFYRSLFSVFYLSGAVLCNLAAAYVQGTICEG